MEHPVRDALARLEAVAREVRRPTGLELLGAMLVGTDGRIDTLAIRGALELRVALAPVIGRLAAERAQPRHVDALRTIVATMREADGDSALLARPALDFWTHLIAATGNLAFVLAFESLATSLAAALEAVRQLLEDELLAVDEYERLVDAIALKRPYAAAERATALVAHGDVALHRVLDAVDAVRDDVTRSCGPDPLSPPR